MRCNLLRIISASYVVALLVWLIPQSSAAEEHAQHIRPFERLTFADNSSIDLVQTGMNTIISVPRSSSSYHKYGESGDGDFDVVYAILDNSLTLLEFSSFQDAFLIELRVHDIPLPWFVPYESSFDIKGLSSSLSQLTVSLSGSASDEIIDFERNQKLKKITQSDAEIVEGDFDANDLIEGESMADFAFQIMDGNGQWVTSKTSTPCDEDPERRFVVAFTAYPRTASHFKLRAIRKGCPPIEFTLKNPTPHSSDDDWLPERLPATRITNDYMVTLSAVNETYVPEYGRRLRAEASIVHSRDIGGHTPKDAFYILPQAVSGPYGGNSTDPGIGGYPLDPSEPKARISFTVQPTINYPYRRDNSSVFAKAVVDSSGELSDLRILDPRLGLLKIDSKIVDGDDLHEITLHGNLKLPYSERRIHETGEELLWKRVVGFVDSEKFCNGTSAILCQSIVSSNSGTDVNFSARWKPFRPLAVGQIITFCLVEPREPETVTFTVDRRDFTQSGNHVDDIK